MLHLFLLKCVSRKNWFNFACLRRTFSKNQPGSNALKCTLRNCRFRKTPNLGISCEETDEYKHKLYIAYRLNIS
jgi:hypothetical protein